jgi:hypothetical protein
LPTRSVKISFARSLNRAEPECLGATGAINDEGRLFGASPIEQAIGVGGVLAARDGLAAEAARQGGLRNWNEACVPLSKAHDLRFRPLGGGLEIVHPAGLDPAVKRTRRQSKRLDAGAACPQSHVACPAISS